MTSENVVPISSEVGCPICGTSMWLKRPGYYGCKFGHEMAQNAMIAPAELEKRLVVIQPRVHWPWWRHAEIPWVLAGVLLIVQIVEVVL